MTPVPLSLRVRARVGDLLLRALIAAGMNPWGAVVIVAGLVGDPGDPS